MARLGRSTARRPHTQWFLPAVGRGLRLAGRETEEVEIVTEVRVGKDETLDSALRRFKRQVKRSGVLSEAKRHEHYEKPSAKRRRKAARRRRGGNR